MLTKLNFELSLVALVQGFTREIRWERFARADNLRLLNEEEHSGPVSDGDKEHYKVTIASDKAKEEETIQYLVLTKSAEAAVLYFICHLC